jgi:hypothetical protein
MLTLIFEGKLYLKKIFIIGFRVLARSGSRCNFI